MRGKMTMKVGSTYNAVRFWKQRIGKGVSIQAELLGQRFYYDHDKLLHDLQRRGHIGQNTKSLNTYGCYSISQQNAMGNPSIREALEPYRVTR